MKYFRFALLLCVIAAFFPACLSTQKKDLHISGPRDQMENDIGELEKLIIPLEAAGGAEARKQKAEMAAARRMVTNLEKSAVDAEYSGRLTAWSGRLAILEGKYSEARRLHRQSVAVSPGNIPSMILGLRLEGDPAKRLVLIERELGIIGQQPLTAGYGELQIEKAGALLELRRFPEAAGAFDAAFASVGLNAVYRDTYQANRQRAWELRNFDGTGTEGTGSGTLAILERGGISWKDCITVTKNETQLLRFITGGRNTSEADLFNSLLERAFIPYTQDVTVTEWPTAKPKIDDPVSRSGAAWYIWHLYAEARADRGLLNRYSSRYATGPNPRSPIADVPPLSPFFDSILGCVETELLSLPDGRNFKNTEAIRGAELLSILKKIDN
jgi:tetratricopeptide (TPR) repeat protein